LAVPAPWESTANLIAHLVIFCFIIVGFAFARRKKFNIHEKFMFPSIVAVGFSFFLWMARSYVNNFNLVVADFYAPGIIITNMHVVLGTITGCLAVYIVLRMKFDLPQRFAVKRVKRLMRATFVLWLVTFLLGVSFYVWYFVI